MIVNTEGRVTFLGFPPTATQLPCQCYCLPELEILLPGLTYQASEGYLVAQAPYK